MESIGFETRTFDSFLTESEGEGLGLPWRGKGFYIRLELYRGTDEILLNGLIGPLRRVPADTDDLEEFRFAFGKSFREFEDVDVEPWLKNLKVFNQTHRILYGETDDAPAMYINGYNRYKTTTKVAKELINALDKYTILKAVAEVTMGPRKGTATKEGKPPRDPSFQPLPRDITRLVNKFVGKQGGKTRKTKKPRRKTVSRKK